jgi:hypothetical protein
MKNRDGSGTIFFEKVFLFFYFIGIYHVEYRETSGIFFPADLRS